MAFTKVSRPEPAAKPARRTRAAPVPKPDAHATVPALIGALLRVPGEAIQRRLIAGLNESGFTELRLAHMPVLQYPGPNGCRPQELAQRAGISKQAMNQLLHSLERLGYVGRTDAQDDGRARSVNFTRRGEAAWARMLELLVTIEAEWRATLGERRFALLKKILGEVWQSDLVPKPKAHPEAERLLRDFRLPGSRS